MTVQNNKLPKNLVFPTTFNTSKAILSNPPKPLQVQNAIARRPFGYDQSKWPITARFRFLNPQNSKTLFRIGWSARWAAIVGLAFYAYVPYSSWYIINGAKFVLGQEYEDIVTTDRSRFFNYSY